MCEQRDYAMMVGFVGVLVKQFMQGGAGRHGIEQQNHSHQQGRESRLAEP